MSAPLHNSDLKAIEAKLGRPLRVLHIGNIANNAYNNACIQRQYGIEADVLSYDYHHVMSTPEWEDAAFEGEVDPDAPNWWATSLKGWKRPDWFVQGPASGCLQYLRAKHLGLPRLQKLLWGYLEARCLGHVRFVAEQQGKPIPPMPLRLGLALKAAQAFDVANGPDLRFSDKAREAIRSVLIPGSIGPPGGIGGQSSHEDANIRTVEAAGIPPPPSKVGGLMVAARASGYAALSILLECGRPLYRMGLRAFVLPGIRHEPPKGLLPRLWLSLQKRRQPTLSPGDLADLVDRGAPRLQQLRNQLGFLFGLRGAWKPLFHAIALRIGNRFYPGVYQETKRLRSYINSIDTNLRDSNALKQINEAKIHLTGVEENIISNFYDNYTLNYSQFFDVIRKYDIIQAYSIDGIACWTNGLNRYISYEHGTLRDLPFGSDYYGIATRIAYHNSTCVFVTNSDVMPSVKRMGLAPERVFCLPHAFNDQKLMHFRTENLHLEPSDGPPIIFSPTRQHWKDKSGSWTKGNDILFRAAAVLSAEGADFRLHLVEWGKEVEDSKALIAELGIANKVVWLPTMQKRELWEAYCKAHAVADQFILPALGGVGFETMALGRRLITAIDEAQLTHFFGKAPPCLSAATIDQCVNQLRRVIADPGDAEQLGYAAQDWMRDYHSAQRIIEIQAAAYATFLASADPV